MSLLEVNSLSASYGQGQVLVDINLSVSEGSVVALMGRNGMGKTSIIKCICGMMDLKQGEIKFSKENITNKKSFQISSLGIGLTPEGRRIFGNLTVWENLRVVERKGNWSNRKVLDLFPRLRDRKNQLGNTLSGGEQQMLSIGRALITNPKLLILDEATEGLAPFIQQEIWKVLRSIKEEGMSILIVDKSLKKLSHLADYFYLVVKGEIGWQGKYKEISEETIRKYLSV